MHTTAHTFVHGHTHAQPHVHHRHTHRGTAVGTPPCSSRLLSFPGSGAGWGRRRCSARAEPDCSMPGPHRVSTVRGLAVRVPRNPAPAGHGLIIFLEKLGFCQVPLLKILPGAGGFPPTEVLSPTLRLLFGGFVESQRPPPLTPPRVPSQSQWLPPHLPPSPLACTRDLQSPGPLHRLFCLPGQPFPHPQHQTSSLLAGSSYALGRSLDGLPQRGSP